MSQATKLWKIKWAAHFISYPDDLWVLANSAEVAAKKARKFLKREGNTSVQVKTVEQHGTIDVF